jgi:hypothetical protein
MTGNCGIVSRMSWKKFNWGRWEEIYEEYKYFNPEVDSGERAKIRRGCSGKSAFSNFWLAMQAAEQYQRKFPDTMRGVGIYRCPLCLCEHIGHNRSSKLPPQSTQHRPNRNVKRSEYGQRGVSPDCVNPFMLVRELLGFFQGFGMLFERRLH